MTDNRLKGNPRKFGSLKKNLFPPDTRGGKKIAMRWLLLISLIALIFCMIVPVITILGLKMEFSSKLESTDAWNGVHNGVLNGATEENYKRTVATDYNARFVPARLIDENKLFTWVEIFYGPILLTGTDLQLSGTSAGGQGLESGAEIELDGRGPAIGFFIIYILILVAMGLFIRNQNTMLKFIVSLTAVWLLYSLLIWALGDFIFGSLNGILNRLLTEEQGSATYSLGLGSILVAPMSMFMAGMLYWVLSFLLIRAKSSPDPNELVPAKSIRP
jgi:hypothetical protein